MSYFESRLPSTESIFSLTDRFLLFLLCIFRLSPTLFKSTSSIAIETVLALSFELEIELILLNFAYPNFLSLGDLDLVIVEATCISSSVAGQSKKSPSTLCLLFPVLDLVFTG